MLKNIQFIFVSQLSNFGLLQMYLSVMKMELMIKFCGNLQNWAIEISYKLTQAHGD